MNARSRPAACCTIRPAPRLPADKLQSWTRLTQALSDATRIEIVAFIAAQDGPVCACDIVDRFELSQPTISHHLKTLCDAGILHAERCGLWKVYQLRSEAAENLSKLVEVMRDENAAAPSVACCDARSVSTP